MQFMFSPRPTKGIKKRKMLRLLPPLPLLQHCRHQKVQLPRLADPAPAPTPAPKRVVPLLSEDEQRQLYKWMLEEKRKIRPRDAAEKNKINEEKALLKEFIRAESLPRL